MNTRSFTLVLLLVCMGLFFSSTLADEAAPLLPVSLPAFPTGNEGLVSAPVIIPDLQTVGISPTNAPPVIDRETGSVAEDEDAGRGTAVTYLYTWGTFGSGNRQFNSPHGIAISPDGNRVYVTDQGNHRILVFNQFGKFITK